MAKINRHDKGASELFNLVDNLEPFYYQEKTRTARSKRSNSIPISFRK